jgi:adenine-specific DNA-methyltransferase
VEIARLNLLLQISESKRILPDLENNIKVGNSLIDDPSVSDRAFKWEDEFPEIMKEGGFDIVIGNPPYIKEYTNRQIFEPIKLTRLKKYYKGKMDIWYLFSCLSIDLLKDGGLHSFIGQNNWITSFGASLLRDKILKETRIISFVDFGDYKVFEGAEIQTMIYVIKKERIDQPYPVQYNKITIPNIDTDKIIEFLNNPKLKSNYSEHMIINFDPKTYFGKEISFVNNSTEIIISKIESNANYHLADNEISTGIDVHQDFVNKNHLQIIKDKSIKIGDGIFVISEGELQELNLNQSEKEFIKPYYTSNELTKYYGDRNNKFYIIYTKNDIGKNIFNFPNIKKHLDKFKDIITSDFAPYGLHRARDQKFFEGEHIVSLRKTAEPCFTYVDFPCYVSQTYFVMKPQGVDMKLLVGILNSKVIHFWLRNKGKKQGKLLQIDKAQLTSLPIALPNNSQEQSNLRSSIIAEVDLIISFVKKMNTSASLDEKELLKDKIGKEIEKLDLLVYKLYELDDNDIRKIETFLSNEIYKNS